MKRWMIAGVLLAAVLCGCGRTEPEPVETMGRPDLEQQFQEWEQQDAQLLRQDAQTQTDINRIARDRYILWDRALNKISGYTRNEDWRQMGTEKLMGEDAQQEQRNWIEGKQNRVRMESTPYAGGSIQPAIMDGVGAEITRLRCYRLAEKFAAATEMPFTLPIPQADPITFVDTQGTDTVYSSLNMTSQDGITYQTVISLHGIGELEGTAEAGEDGFLFRDEVLGVSGGIYYMDGGSGAVLNIMQSDWNQLDPGMEFVFSVRMTEAEL